MIQMDKHHKQTCVDNCKIQCNKLHDTVYYIIRNFYGNNAVNYCCPVLDGSPYIMCFSRSVNQ